MNRQLPSCMSHEKNQNSIRDWDYVITQEQSQNGNVPHFESYRAASNVGEKMEKKKGFRVSQRLKTNARVITNSQRENQRRPDLWSAVSCFQLRHLPQNGFALWKHWPQACGLTWRWPGRAPTTKHRLHCWSDSTPVTLSTAGGAGRLTWLAATGPRGTSWTWNHRIHTKTLASD